MPRPLDPFDKERLAGYFGKPENPETGDIDYTSLLKYAKLVYLHSGELNIDLLRPYIPQTAPGTTRESDTKVRLESWKWIFQQRVWGSNGLVPFVYHKSTDFNKNAPENAQLHHLTEAQQRDWWCGIVTTNGCKIIKDLLAVFRAVVDIPKMLEDSNWRAYWTQLFVSACMIIYDVKNSKPGGPSNYHEVYVRVRSVVQTMYRAHICTIPLVAPRGPR